MGMLFLLELLGCTILPLPMALIMVALVTAAPLKWARFALSASLGSIAGGILLYIIGRAFFSSAGSSLISYYGSEGRWSDIIGWFNGEWGIVLIVIAGVTTGLFRIASLAAGFTGMTPVVFVIFLAASRFVRWFGEAYAIMYMTRRLKVWPKRYYTYATVGAAAIVVVTLLVVSLVV
jgi:membrane protein YqaA with SNARE-associated domain